MALPLLFALVYLLLSARILVDVRLKADKVRRGIRIGLRAWGMRICLDMPLKLSVDSMGAKAQVRKAKRAWPFVRAVIRAIRWGQADARFRIGMQDAAVTAMLAGTIRSLGAVLQAAAGQRFPCDIAADAVFGRPCFALSLRCIFSFVPGDIMFAAAKAAVKTTQREGFSWLSIPLKA